MDKTKRGKKKNQNKRPLCEAQQQWRTRRGEKTESESTKKRRNLIEKIQLLRRTRNHQRPPNGFVDNGPRTAQLAANLRTCARSSYRSRRREEEEKTKKMEMELGAYLRNGIKCRENFDSGAKKLWGNGARVSKRLSFKKIK